MRAARDTIYGGGGGSASAVDVASLLKSALASPYLVVVRFGVLHRLEADGHDGEGRRRQVFDHADEVGLQSQGLHLTPAGRLAHAL